MGLTDIRDNYYNARFAKNSNDIIIERTDFYKNSNSIIVIDCISGKSKTICKNCYDPVFSESNNFILYKSIEFRKNLNRLPLFYIYDRTRDLSIPLRNIKAAFWLF